MTTNAPIHYTLADGTTGVASSFTELHEPPPGYVWRNMGGTVWRQVPAPPAVAPALADALERLTARHGVGMDAEFYRRQLNAADGSPDAPA